MSSIQNTNAKLYTYNYDKKEGKRKEVLVSEISAITNENTQKTVCVHVRTADVWVQAVLYSWWLTEKPTDTKVAERNWWKE